MVKDNKLEPVAEVGGTYILLWAGSETISAIHERSGVKVGSMLVTVDQAEAHSAAKVREALEEAAKVCDEYWKELDGARRSGNIGKYIEGALDCADILERRIKALIPGPTGDSNVATD